MTSRSDARRLWPAGLLAGLLILGTACGGAPPGEPGPDTTAGEPSMDESETGRPSIRQVMDRHREDWMARPEVTGMGIGRCEGEPCIVLYLIRESEEAERALPDSVGSYPVRLEVTGRIVPRTPPEDTADDGN